MDKITNRPYTTTMVAILVVAVALLAFIAGVDESALNPNCACLECKCESCDCSDENQCDCEENDECDEKCCK